MLNSKFPIEEVKAQKDKLLANPELVEEFSFNVKKEELVIKTKKNIKTAEQWAEEYLNSKEGKLEMEKINQEVKDYILFGKPTRYLNEQLLDEIKNFKGAK